MHTNLVRLSMGWPGVSMLLRCIPDVWPVISCLALRLTSTESKAVFVNNTIVSHAGFASSWLVLHWEDHYL